MRVHGTVRLGDGIVLELPDGPRCCFDGATPAAASVLSHGHTDHLARNLAGPVACSALTAALASERRGVDIADRRETIDLDRVRLDLLPAGHVAGSRAAMVTDHETDRRYLYTGDVCTRDRLYLPGFEPPAADVLIVEATYGRPRYRFPPFDALVAEVQDWLATTGDRVTVLFGYPLGRAQKLQRIVATGPARDRRCFVSPNIHRLNAVVGSHLDVPFPAERFDDGTGIGAGDIVVTAGSPNRSSLLEALDGAREVTTAGFSGWAVDSSYRYRGGYDVTFPLSDHCDFPDLVALVRAVDPETVYTHHGFAAPLASHLERELGIRSRPLVKHQSTLDAFLSTEPGS